jgi:hypothetical protein
MFRQAVTRPLFTANRAVFNRSFSVIAPRMGEGDLGAPKPGGAAHEYVPVPICRRITISLQVEIVVLSLSLSSLVIASPSR